MGVFKKRTAGRVWILRQTPALSRSIWGMERQQRARVAPSLSWLFDVSFGYSLGALRIGRWSVKGAVGAALWLKLLCLRKTSLVDLRKTTIIQAGPR